MAKSKFVELNQKIAENVTGVFAAVEDSVISGYTKIEDAFVDRYLTREGETTEAAKKRLQEEKHAKQTSVKN